MALLFVSHSTKDGVLVRRFLTLLMEGAGVPKRSIFCTSAPGTIPQTRDWVPHIKNRLRMSCLFVPVLSDAYADSAFSLVELGASWVLSKKTLPIVVPPFDFGDDLEILHRTQHCRIGQQDDLLELLKALKRCQGLTRPRSPEDESESVRQFLADLPPLLSRAEYWVYALRAIKGDTALKVFGCFEVTPVPRTQSANAVRVKGQCYWVEDGGLRERGAWWSNVPALRETDRLFLSYHMKSSQVGHRIQPEEHDGIIHLTSESGTPLIGDKYYRGFVNDLREWRDTSGDMFAERLTDGEYSWTRALELVRTCGQDMFERFTAR